jgi:hypothetical protein
MGASKSGSFQNSLNQRKFAGLNNKTVVKDPAPQAVAKTPAPQATQTKTSDPNQSYWDYLVEERVWDPATQTTKVVKSTVKNLQDQGLVSSTSKPSTSSTNSNAETKAADLADAYVKNTMQEQKKQENELFPKPGSNSARENELFPKPGSNSARDNELFPKPGSNSARDNELFPKPGSNSARDNKLFPKPGSNLLIGPAKNPW